MVSTMESAICGQPPLPDYEGMEHAYNLLKNGLTSFTSTLLLSPITIREDSQGATIFPLIQGAGGDFWRSQAAICGGLWGRGRYIACSHEGHFRQDSIPPNFASPLGENILAWLGNGFAGKSIGFCCQNQEWLTVNNFAEELQNWCHMQGIICENISCQDYSGYDIVVVGNPWQQLPAAEIERLESYLRGGGGLLICGLGWSWTQYRQDDTCENMPVNELGALLGFKFAPGTMGKEFLVSPAPSRKILLEQQTEEQLLADLGKGGSVPALEGQYVILRLPAALWAQISYPRRTIELLDSLYEQQYDFIGSPAHPYETKLWFIINESSPHFMYMALDHCGMNGAGGQYFVENLGKTPETLIPAWGIGHEIGHAMVNFCCGGLFQPAGTNESWNNILNFYSYQENGLADYAYQFLRSFAANYSGAQNKYSHLQQDYDLLPNEEREFAILLANPWIFVKLPLLIIEHYGWQGMMDFFSGAAQDKAAGLALATDEEKTAYMIVKLSQAYQLDFSPLFAYWKFTIREEITQQLQGLPQEKLISSLYGQC